MTIINMSGGKPAKPIVVEAVEETPSTLPYTFSPREGVDYLSSVTVGKDPNLVPGNVKQGVNIFGVEGTLSSSGIDLSTIDPSVIRGLNNRGAIWGDDGIEVQMTEETGVAQVYPNYQGWGVSGIPGTVLFQGVNQSYTTTSFSYTKKYTTPTSFHGLLTTGGATMAWNAGDEVKGYVLPQSSFTYQTNIMAVEREDVFVGFTAVIESDTEASITLEQPIEFVANDKWTADVMSNIRLTPVLMYKVN